MCKEVGEKRQELEELKEDLIIQFSEQVKKDVEQRLREVLDAVFDEITVEGDDEGEEEENLKCEECPVREDCPVINSGEDDEEEVEDEDEELDEDALKNILSTEVLNEFAQALEGVLKKVIAKTAEKK